MTHNLRQSVLHLRLALVATLSVCCVIPAYAQVSGDQYQGYFLVGRFGEVCTMCEVVVLCESGAETGYENIPATGEFTIYHLRTRTFWSQISTIWEFFIANFSTESLAARGHTRPVDVYTVKNDSWSAGQTVEARLILDPAYIELGETRIDRTDRQWLNASDDQSLGYCQRMPLWESIETIETQSGGEQ